MKLYQIVKLWNKGLILICGPLEHYLDAEEWRPLLVEDVPAVEAAVPARGEEDGGARRAPAA